MKNLKPINPFAPHEIRNFITPLMLGTLVLITSLIVETITNGITANYLLFTYCLIAVIYVTSHYIYMSRLISTGKFFGLSNAIIAGIGVGILPFITPVKFGEAARAMIVFGTVTIATISGKRYAHLTLIGIFLISLPKIIDIFASNFFFIVEFFIPFIVSIGIIEVIVRIQDTTKHHIRRLETINQVSRQIMQSLDAQEILTLLDTTIQNALVADTYFIGFLEGDKIRLDLFYDDGEYFNGTHAPINGTLSGWVINNQKEIFLPDLRNDVQIENVQLFTAGKEKTSHSWMGVPLKAKNVMGILALASYTANAFDRADLELLISLGQHVTLALDNAIRHKEVERQAQLDSLTEVYNHASFLRMLAIHAEEATAKNAPLSLIMLDIDHFKQYNDVYGHLVGDRVLTSLCTAIKNNIKHTDVVGRWGGEEFVISLPNTNGEQATHVAKRISETLGALNVKDREQQTIPIPTISQGIAVYRRDADEIYKLVDAADRRLYKAKERGRNQIEPAPDDAKR